MKKILVPTDFSEQANYALKAAAKIAKMNDSEIYILHLIDIPNLNAFNGVNAEVPEIIYFKNAVEEKLNEISSQSFLKGLTIYSILKIKKVFEGIEEIAKEHEINLIVMGSNGSSGIKELTVGSNTEKVVRTSSVPVFVIKGQNEDLNFDKFTFASDFEPINKPNFEKAVAFTKIFDAELHLLYINTPANFGSTEYINNKLNGFITDYPKIHKHIYNDFTVEKGIVNFNNKNKMDLTIMNTQGRKGIAHFLNGSISEDMVNHSKRPILTFKL